MLNEKVTVTICGKAYNLRTDNASSLIRQGDEYFRAYRSSLYHYHGSLWIQVVTCIQSDGKFLVWYLLDSFPDHPDIHSLRT